MMHASFAAIVGMGVAGTALAANSFVIEASQSTIGFCVPCLGLAETCGVFHGVPGRIDIDAQAPER